MCHSDLRFLLESFTEVERHLKKVQWFERVNADGVNGILAKLERYGQAGIPSYQYTKTRWLELQRVWETHLLSRLDRIGGLIVDIQDAVALPEQATRTSLYLDRALRQYPCPRFRTGALQHTLQHGGAASVFKLLISANTPPDVLEPNIQNLIRELLRHSAMILPQQVAALLASLPEAKHSAIDQGVLNWSIVTIGREKMKKCEPGESSRQLPQADLTSDAISSIFEALRHRATGNSGIRAWRCQKRREAIRGEQRRRRP